MRSVSYLSSHLFLQHRLTNRRSNYPPDQVAHLLTTYRICSSIARLTQTTPQLTYNQDHLLAKIQPRLSVRKASLFERFRYPITKRRPTSGSTLVLRLPLEKIASPSFYKNDCDPYKIKKHSIKMNAQIRKRS